MPIVGALRRSGLLSLALCAACHTTPGADRVLKDYFRHLRAGQIAEAYALTTPAHRARRDLRTFALAVARQPIFERVEQQLAQRSVSVELLADDGSVVRLIAEAPGERVHLVDDPLDLYPASTPEAALRSFTRAVALGRRDRVVPLLAPVLRERLGPGDPPLPEALVELGHRIEQHLKRAAAPLVTDGISARWLLGEGAAISLELGPSGWWLSALE